MDERLTEQIGFIRSSLELYEKSEGESKRLATTLRVLFHDTNASHSLAGQLGIIDDLRFLETKAPVGVFANWNISHAEVDLDGDFLANSPYAGLLAKKISGESDLVVEFLPLYLGSNYKEDRFNRVDFADWWNATIFDDKSGIQLSRRSAVLCAANKDGGAHIDPSGNTPEYQKFKDCGIMPIMANGQPRDSGTVPIYAALAQIGYEAINAIEHHFASHP
jgi:hypothetical protein